MCTSKKCVSYGHRGSDRCTPNKEFPMKLDSIENLFVHELTDSNRTPEKQLIKALPKMAKGASSDALRTAFEEHLEQTKGHVDRLEKIFALIDKPSRAEHCKAMEGLVEEGSDLLKEEGSPMVKDAALIGAAQRVEHYEIAAYGTTRSLAELLGHTEAVELLQETLDEEKETDEKLTELAQSEVKSESTSPSKAR